MQTFLFQSFGEYRTALEVFNVTAEEIKGEHDGKPYHGILYQVIDEKGQRLGQPFKSSLFGKSVGYEALQKHYEASKDAVEKKQIREHLRLIIAQAMRQATDKKDFVRRLKAKEIGVSFRVNEAGKLYGVTFVDYTNRVIMNGSRLGREFSANQVEELFRQRTETATTAHIYNVGKPSQTATQAPSLNPKGSLDLSGLAESVSDAVGAIGSLLPTDAELKQSYDDINNRPERWLPKKKKKRKFGRQL
jgi:hypothetical protein